MTRPVFCLMGPTASGKTDLAARLVQEYPFEIISVDSAMIYRDMNIGTAKPTASELIQTPHHLIDIIDPVDSYSAAQFCKDASYLCETVFQKQRIPLLVGGTMMYFNALQKGLSQLPEANAQIREQIAQEALAQGWQVLHEKLVKVDPLTAQRIHPNDAQRISRALEVYYQTGKVLSEHLDLESPSKPLDFQFVNLVLFPENRTWLHQRIADRFEQMLAQHFIEEVAALIKKWPATLDMPALRCVGYRQVYDYLQGNIHLQALKDKGMAATRQLAKRQLTWLRHWPDAIYFDPLEKDCQRKVMAKVQEILDNSSFD